MVQYLYQCYDGKPFNYHDYKFVVCFENFPDIFDLICDEIRILNIEYRLVTRYFNRFFNPDTRLLLCVSKEDFPKIKELIDKYDL